MRIRLAKSCTTSLQSAEIQREASLGTGALGGHHSPLTVSAGTEMAPGISLSSQRKLQSCYYRSTWKNEETEAQKKALGH